MPENRFEKILDFAEQVSDIDYAKNIKWAISFFKDKYFQAMDAYSDWLDTAKIIPGQVWISPNQISTLRAIAGTSLWATIALVDWWAYEAPLIALFWTILFHDAVDGHHARNTNQTSAAWETLDAWDDKIKVFIILWILLWTMTTSPLIMLTLIIAYLTLLWLDVKSQLMRWNNKEAFLASWQKPLTQEDRDDNPNIKTSWASVSAGKVKTWVVMTWLTVWLMEDIPWFEWGSDNAIPLLVTLLLSTGFALKSLKDKWVTPSNFFKKEAA